MITPNEMKDDIKEPEAQNPARAARGDNEGISQAQPQQQQQGMPGSDVVKGKWKQHVGAAKIAWGELTEDELLKSEGHVQKLTGLVQERYGISLDEAEKQVKSFIGTQKS